MGQTQELNPGVTSAKHESRDELLVIMRKVLKDNPGIRQSGAVRLAIEALHEHEDYEPDLRDAAERYAMNNIWRRLGRPNDSDGSKPPREPREPIIRELILANIVLWRWKLPTTGKTISESTFGELAEAAPIVGRFFAKLATVGAPGTLVREVFKNEKALQEFWRSAQS